MADSKKRGRPSNESKLETGGMIVSKTCKICQSSVRDEITQAILQKQSSTVIIEKYNSLFDGTLTATNIHSHKKHISPEVAVKADRAQTLAAVTEYNPTTKALFQHQYDKAFDKQKAADEMYKQRLANLFQLQHEIEQHNAAEAERPLTAMEAGIRRDLIRELELSYRGFQQDLIKHIQVDADILTSQMSLKFVESVFQAYLQFTQRFMDVMVKEIDDKLTRERVKEQLIELLESVVKPHLDPEKTLDAKYEIVNDPKPPQV